MTDEHMKALAKTGFDQRIQAKEHNLAVFKNFLDTRIDEYLSRRTAAGLATQRLQELKGERGYKKGEETHRRCETAVSDARWEIIRLAEDIKRVSEELTTLVDNRFFQEARLRSEFQNALKVLDTIVIDGTEDLSPPEK